MRRYRGVTVYTGLPGDGKTYSLALAGYRAMQRGRQVWTNKGFDLEGAETFDSFESLLSVPPGSVILWDEMPVYLSARDWQSFPAEVLYRFTLIRKDGLELHYSAIDLEMCDANLRRITAWEVECRAVLGRLLLRRCWPALPKRRAKQKRATWTEFAVVRPRVAGLYDTLAKVHVDPPARRSARLSVQWSAPPLAGVAEAVDGTAQPAEGRERP